MTVKEYFSRGYFSDADAQTIGAELERLANLRHSTAADILSAAEVDTSPLHAFFEWDDGTAAHEYRLVQARGLAQKIFVRVTDTKTGEQREVRAFYAVTVGPEKRRAFDPGLRQYVSIEQVTRSLDFRSQVIGDAKRQLFSWRERHAQYVDFFGEVFRAIDRLREDEEERAA